jgi:AmiR/NasT family two-component response regulator
VPDSTDHERIADLEAARGAHNRRLNDLEAADLVLDERMLALVAEIDGLHGKIEHRAVIEQAKGVIMSSMGCGADAAFAVLVAQSQDQNRKLHEIAAELAHAQDHPAGVEDGSEGPPPA